MFLSENYMRFEEESERTTVYPNPGISSANMVNDEPEAGFGSFVEFVKFVGFKMIAPSIRYPPSVTKATNPQPRECREKMRCGFPESFP